MLVKDSIFVSYSFSLLTRSLYKDFLHLFRHHFGDPAALGHITIVDILSYASFAGKVTLGDSLALGAPKFFSEPFRKAVPGIERVVEFVHIIRKCVPAANHERQHTGHPQVAVFYFADFQPNDHHAGGIGTTGQSLEQSPAHKGGGSIEQFLINWKSISQMMKHGMGAMKIALLHMTI